jgi:predicted DNA-binding protein with PD1-like motif
MDSAEFAALVQSVVQAEDLKPRFFCDKCGMAEENHDRGGHDFVEGEVETYCNIAVHRIACMFDYPFFKGMLANEIIKTMKKDSRWTAVEPREASKMAWGGNLVIAGQTGKVHGHVAVCAPYGTVYSGKWKEDCPTVANVGAKNGILGANQAFGGPDQPVYYLLSDA